MIEFKAKAPWPTLSLPGMSPSVSPHSRRGARSSSSTDATSTDATRCTDLVVDPLFCAPATADFHVDSTSPCLPQNNPSCGELIGAWPQGCGTVSTESESWGRIKERYRALPEETKP